MNLKLLLLPALLAIAGCTSTQVKQGAMAHTQMQPTRGNSVTGTVTFTQHDEWVHVEAKLSGLTPGLHGFHIHEKGDCSAPDASSAGGHFNPTHSQHGGPAGSPRHAGDLGNLRADALGNATLELSVSGISVSATAPNGIIGRAVIVHAGTDDYTTQPSGNSGPRVACGVIVAE